MSHDERTPTTDSQLPRRRILGAGAMVGASLLAGCLADDDDDADTTPTSTPEAETAGRFRLLISDQPVAIDDFDSLTVTLDEARVFGEEAADPEPTPTPDEPTPTPTPDEPTPTPTPDEPTPTPTPDEPTPTPTPNETPTDGATGLDSDNAEQRGYFMLDLEDAAVDLTEVVGDRAIEVFDGELAPGRYTKIELYPSDVEGIVDGEGVTVHVPSDRLQLTKPFELGPDETVGFVFDINVVRRGQNDEYNLTPVIGESGVIGEDLEGIEEIDPDDPDD